MEVPELILSNLRNSIIKKFGRNVMTAADCESLASVIYEEQRQKMSAQTLRRLFGLIKNENKGYHLYTLNTLSQYCGFFTFDDFRKTQDFRELEVLFGGTEEPNIDYWGASEYLCRQIVDNPLILIETHYKLMNLPIARKYLMEHHPMRDMACSMYSQYFLEYLKYNNGHEARLFAYGFLFMGAFLSDNQTLQASYFQQILQTELVKEVYVLPAGRKFGVILLYADLTKNEILFQKTWKEMLKVRKDYIDASMHSVCSFEYTVLEHLIFTDRIDEMLFLVDNNIVQKFDDKSFVPTDREKSHREVWKILEAVVYQKLHKFSEVNKIVRRINLSLLNFGWQKYYTLIYFLCLSKIEGRKKKKMIEKGLELSRELHMTYFEREFLKLKK